MSGDGENSLPDFLSPHSDCRQKVQASFPDKGQERKKGKK